mgnify:CR=1 FL=1
MDWVVLFFVLVLVVGVQGVFALFLNDRMTKSINVSIDALEKQINSNMERQIRQAVGEAIAQERLSVSQHGR